MGPEGTPELCERRATEAALEEQLGSWGRRPPAQTIFERAARARGRTVIEKQIEFDRSSSTLEVAA